MPYQLSVYLLTTNNLFILILLLFCLSSCPVALVNYECIDADEEPEQAEQRQYNKKLTESQEFVGRR